MLAATSKELDKMTITNIPEWIGVAILGAILAVLGYIGKQVAEWFTKLYAEKRTRRARLIELFALVRAGDAAWKVQCENRDRLATSLSKNPIFAGDQRGYDYLFAHAFPSMTPEELKLHAIIRAMTVYTFQPLNEALLKWLSSDTEFRVRPPGNSRKARLAQYLFDLEVHLLLWQAKFRAWIPDHPEHALVYLADEERHGIGFPPGGVELVAELLEWRLTPSPGDSGFAAEGTGWLARNAR